MSSYTSGSTTKDNSGFYSIRCAPNGKIYIGSSAGVRMRFSSQKSLLRNGRHYNKELQADFKKYSEENFVFTIEQFTETQEEALKIESALIKKFKERGISYNIFIADGSSEHGTIARYNNKKCRCEPCRVAATAARQEYRLRA